MFTDRRRITDFNHTRRISWNRKKQLRFNNKTVLSQYRRNANLMKLKSIPRKYYITQRATI